MRDGEIRPHKRQMSVNFLTPIEIGARRENQTTMGGRECKTHPLPWLVKSLSLPFMDAYHKRFWMLCLQQTSKESYA